MNAEAAVRREVDYGVYLVTDRALCRGRALADVVAAAVAGGVTVVQLREKHADTHEFVELARALKALLAPRGVPLLINDRVDVAQACRADGVHVGQGDMHPAEVRALLGHTALVGLSVETMDQAREAETLDVDYLGVSPVFATPTKTDTAPPWGLDGLARLRAATGRTLVAIGGIGAANAASVLTAGADGLAVVSALCAADDPERAAAELRRAVRTVRGW
ncbi:thiamine phosphate synthase [Nitratidesulfovibrio sp. HK-II]|uniref:thiamine phosphate synthase n=1 Tax=Nitratidesulfovibrio sp. HK-II TaxID=2009266 RepID=UPI000E2E4FF9|nr:thiamine phosphate synthase [Nitratidesulfovibrio sp. HK-II]GBO96585.1 thiamin-phosphate pyrophosphorylase [Nitratidesulfovibrio sp. HK-II]